MNFLSVGLLSVWSVMSEMAFLLYLFVCIFYCIFIQHKDFYMEFLKLVLDCVHSETQIEEGKLGEKITINPLKMFIFQGQ